MHRIIQCFILHHFSSFLRLLCHYISLHRARLRLPHYVRFVCVSVCSIYLGQLTVFFFFFFASFKSIKCNKYSTYTCSMYFHREFSHYMYIVRIVWTVSYRTFEEREKKTLEKRCSSHNKNKQTNKLKLSKKRKNCGVCLFVCLCEML